MKARYFLLALALTACGGTEETDYGGSSGTQTAEEACATIGNQFGNAFFCGTAQANLQPPGGFPDGSLGYCMVAGTNLGNVGYSAYTFNGGAFPVTTQAQASDQARLLGNQSPGYTRCTRIL